MLHLKPELQAKLDGLEIHVEPIDAETVVFNAVPVHPQFFNKPRTNLLVKRLGANMPFLECVDEDLQYTGADPALARAFSTGRRRQGWRALFLDHQSQGDLQAALERALELLGSDGQEPAMTTCAKDDPSLPDTGLFASFATDLTAQAKAGTSPPTINRAEEIQDVASCAIRWTETRVALIVGHSGVGKTNLLHAVARRLSERCPELVLLALDLGNAFAGTLFDCERDNLLTSLLNELVALPNTVVAIEHLELAIREAPHGPVLLAKAADQGATLLGTALPAHLGLFACEPLARRMQIVQLDEPTPAQTVEILLALRERIATHHHIEIDDSIAQAAITAAAPLQGHFPAKAIALLDAAAARAALNNAHVIGLDDIYHATRHSPQHNGPG